MADISEMPRVRAIDGEIEAIRVSLRDQGVFLRAGRDLHDFERHIASQPMRDPVHEQFDTSGDMDGAVDAFWVCGFNSDGDLVHTQAAHLLDLKSRTVSDHIKRTLPRYFPKKPALIRSSARAQPGPKMRRISGRVAYHGEMWLADGLRDKGTAALVNRLGMCMCVREWDPNAVFGLMSWVLACDGFNMRIGYTHSEPMTLTFERKSDLRQHQVWVVYMEREDIQFLLDLPAVEFSSYLRRGFK